MNLRNPLYVEYHDKHWGVPQHDDAVLFEFLVLESFQAGLSWECILNKREGFRAAFDGFDVEKVAAYDEGKIACLMNDAGIVRNRLKIKAAVTNAAVFCEIQRQFGSFDRYIWSFTDGETVFEECDLFTSSPLSDKVSADLKKRGMKFVGTTIIYSYLQAVGIINGHCKICSFYKKQA